MKGIVGVCDPQIDHIFFRYCAAGVNYFLLFLLCAFLDINIECHTGVYMCNRVDLLCLCVISLSKYFPFLKKICIQI